MFKKNRGTKGYTSQDRARPFLEKEKRLYWQATLVFRTSSPYPAGSYAPDSPKQYPYNIILHISIIVLSFVSGAIPVFSISVLTGYDLPMRYVQVA